MDADVDSMEDDTHICFKCRLTVTGLDNYVRHRKFECGGVSGDVSMQEVKTDIQDVTPQADDFFSSLELQSSAKKPTASASTTPPAVKANGVLTRSKATFVSRSHNQRQMDAASEDLQIIGELLRTSDNDEALKRDVDAVQHMPAFEDEANYDFDDFGLLDDEVPPRYHTGGKWRPGGNQASTPVWLGVSTTSNGDEERHGPWVSLLEAATIPPPSYTGGKWKPQTPTEVLSLEHHSEDEYEYEGPPPGHTSGKWAPGRDARPDGGGILIMSPQTYWCGPCNRRLTSKSLYEKHLRSELHSRRTMKERELDDDLHLENTHHEVKAEPLVESLNRGEGKRAVKPTEVYQSSEVYAGQRRKAEVYEEIVETCEKKRKKRKEFVRCEVCKVDVCSSMLGKHLVSHYHCRKARHNDPINEQLILDNIHSVVRQAPFHCSPCKFYCHTMDTFKMHWRSETHMQVDATTNGRYWCSICKCVCETTSDMREHFESEDHKELIISTNNSVPIVIRKRQNITCWTCDEEFQYNAQLRRHCSKTLHPDFNSAEDQRFFCNLCKFRAHSRRSLQHHMTIVHKDQAEYFCSLCGLNFSSSLEASAHRKSQEHKYKSLEDRRTRGFHTKELGKICQHCGNRFDNVLELKTHLREEHPDSAYRCPHCGKTFALFQEVSRHVRDKICHFFTDHQEETISDPHPQPPRPVQVNVDAYSDIQDLNCKRDCPFVSASKAEYIFHDILHDEPIYEDGNTEVGKYRCTFCKRLFRKAILLSHLNTHVGDRPYTCEYCDKAFGYRSSLVTHVKKMHPLGVEETGECFECEESKCHFKTTNRVAFENHRYKHVPGERQKPFLCAVCGNSFVSNLTEILPSRALSLIKKLMKVRIKMEITTENIISKHINVAHKTNAGKT